MAHTLIICLPESTEAAGAQAGDVTKILRNMKKMLILLALVSACFSGMAQDRETLKERIERWKSDMEEFNQGRSGVEKRQAAIDTLSWLQAQSALKDSSFVVEADAVTFKYGTRVQVNSTTNFVSLDGDRAVIQVSPSYAYSGLNGVGGITVEGVASNVKITYDKKGRMHFKMDVIGRGVNATVSISAYPGSNRVTVDISPTFNSNDIRLEGYLLPYEHSRVFEGMSI